MNATLVLMLRLLTVVLLVLPSAAPWPAAGQDTGTVSGAINPQIYDLRLGVHPDKTRLVLDLSGPLPFRVFTLVEPMRIVVDLPPVDWRVPGTLGRSGGGLVGGFRFGQFDPATSRLVLDLKVPAAIAQAFLLAPVDGAPHRLVIDLVASDAASFSAAAGAPPATAVASAATGATAATTTPPTTPPVGDGAATTESTGAAGLPDVQLRPPAVTGLRLIAIDAGHGGVDPGAIGVRGSYEKSITLAYARALAARLEATGRYTVYLTRQEDGFLRLRDRVARARARGAEIFISLHADSNPDRGLRGASVYTLSENASDSEAAALAAKENKADIIAGIDLTSESLEVSGILIDLAQRETMNLSARFAGMLTSELAQEISVLRKSHRFAGFAVLKAPDVPSVLVELGYLSNREDETRLLGSEHRQAVGTALLRALDAYFAWADTLSRT